MRSLCPSCPIRPSVSLFPPNITQSKSRPSPPQKGLRRKSKGRVEKSGQRGAMVWRALSRFSRQQPSFSFLAPIKLPP